MDRDEFDGEQLWWLTLQHSPVGMSLASPDGRLLAVNEALCRMLGYDAEQLRGLTFQQITHPEDLPADLEFFAQTLAGERTSYRIVKRYLHADGHHVWVDLSVALLRDDEGTPIHFIGQILDMTAHHDYRAQLADAQATIERQRRMAEAVFDTVDIGLLLIDREGRYERTNRPHREFMALGFPEGHAGLAGQLGEVFGHDGTTRLSRAEMPTHRAVQGEEFEDVRAWVGADPLTRRALSVSARTVRDEAGEPTGFALAYKDVTDYVQALEVKDEFVASVSHELRTPLTSVLGHLEIVSDHPGLPDDVAAQLDTIQRNALRLRHLVSDLLHVASGKQGGLQITRSETDVVGVVADAVTAASPGARAERISLGADLPPELIALVDAHRFRQVADNLISNGIKYSESGGEVLVRLGLEAGDILLEVCDSGLGIAPDDLERLFTRFFRGQQARDRHIQGTGLGLNIVRSIVEAHGGRVSVASEVGVGSVVRVRLPRVAP